MSATYGTVGTYGTYGTWPRQVVQVVQVYSGTVVKGTGITLVPFLVGFLSPNPPSTHLRLEA